MKSSMHRNLADDSTTLAEDSAERCQSEIVNVLVNIVGMINRVLAMTIQRWNSVDNDPTTIRQRPTLVQPKPSNLFCKIKSIRQI